MPILSTEFYLRSKTRPTKQYIETGTYLGDGIRGVLGHYETIHSIELSEKWFNHNVEQFKNNQEVKVHHGDSKKILPELLANIHEPVTIFLDAHYSGSFTEFGEEETPLLKELEILRERKYDDIIIIDDCRLLGKKGTCGVKNHPIYPTMQYDWTDVTEDKILEKMRPGYERLDNLGGIFSNEKHDQIIFFIPGKSQDMKLTTHVKNGLGDRLLDVIGFVALCKKNGVRGSISWADHNHNFRWGPAIYDLDLLDFSELSEIVEIKSKGSPIRAWDELFIDNINQSATLSPFNIHVHREKTDINKTVKDFIESAQKIKVSEKIEKHIFKDLENYIGIHLRRTDKIKQELHGSNALHETSTKQYENLMKNLLNKIKEDIRSSESDKFYVVSDDIEYKKIFVEKILDIAKTENKEIKVHITSQDDLPENTLKLMGAYELYELFSLSKCKKIYQGIKYSTYSLFAALKSQVPIVNFSDHEKGWLLYAWVPCLNLQIQEEKLDHIVDLDKMKEATDFFRRL
jgi:hypothetical protein